LAAGSIGCDYLRVPAFSVFVLCRLSIRSTWFLFRSVGQGWGALVGGGGVAWLGGGGDSAVRVSYDASCLASSIFLAVIGLLRAGAVWADDEDRTPPPPVPPVVLTPAKILVPGYFVLYKHRPGLVFFLPLKFDHFLSGSANFPRRIRPYWWRPFHLTFSFSLPATPWLFPLRFIFNSSFSSPCPSG